MFVTYRGSGGEPSRLVACVPKAESMNDQPKTAFSEHAHESAQVLSGEQEGRSLCREDRLDQLPIIPAEDAALVGVADVRSKDLG